MRNENTYIRWLERKVNCNTGHYHKLLRQLYDKDFEFSMDYDENRAIRGLGLRDEYDISIEDKPCSILEMMVGLASDCEVHFMDDSDYGDRTCEWFWGMIENLGLNDMSDDNYDPEFVDQILDIFLRRDYEANGEGGLFKVECGRDMRDLDIWYQMCLYVNTLM